MGIVDGGVVKYISNVIPEFGGALGEIYEQALKDKMPVIPPEAARFLAVILSLAKPKNVLEIGCAVGFSAGIFAKYLPDGGHITTIDRYDFMITEAKKNFKKLGIEDKVTLIEGEALAVLKTLNESYDFIFMDAAKGQYINMLPFCLRLLNLGGILLADDIFQNGDIIKDRLAVKRRQRTIHTRMRAFLEEVCAAKELEVSIIPIGDGMVLAHKVAECRNSELER
ncbi:MAG: O-methyltransferase [Clostridiales bacterium]|jgi:predicted O-methyltransferase YrrM|nr:O-methyltransferase [Clostridiales bacterium]